MSRNTQHVRTRMAVSTGQPILEPEAGHFAKISRIAGQQNGIMSDRDARDFQIEAPNTNTLLPILYKKICSIRIPRKHGPRRVPDPPCSKDRGAPRQPRMRIPNSTAGLYQEPASSFSYVCCFR